MALFDIFRSDDGIGLVLGGGGARGFFHVGVVNALRDNNIKVSRIAGTSVGAVIGALYAADPDINFSKVISEINLITFSKLVASSYYTEKTSEIEKFFRKHIKATDFKDFKIPLTFNATDMNNKKEVIFSNGSIYPGLIASVSIPGILAPVKYGDTFLIDGGIMNNVPVSHLKDEKKILVSDITGPIKVIDEKTNNIDVLYSSVALLQQVNSMNLLAAEGKKNHDLIHIELGDNKTFILDFRRSNFDDLIMQGYKAVEKVLDQLK